MFIYFITGASGTGKTTLLEKLKEQLFGEWVFLHFDSIEVPSKDKMIKEYGSPREWQKEKTNFWISKILKEYKNKKIIIEGQVDLKLIIDVFSKYDFTEYKIILMDCNEEIMYERLKYRKQNYLIDEDMKNWLKYLRNQAKELNVDILNTSNKNIEETVLLFQKIILN
jgi:dephospho-CoA kinase